MRSLLILLAAGLVPAVASASCSSIPAWSVQIVPGGYELKLTAGEHPALLSAYETFIPFDGAFESPDTSYHACFSGGTASSDLLGTDPTTTKDYPQWKGGQLFLSKFLAPGARA